MSNPSTLLPRLRVSRVFKGKDYVWGRVRHQIPTVASVSTDKIIGVKGAVDQGLSRTTLVLPRPSYPRVGPTGPRSYLS